MKDILNAKLAKVTNNLNIAKDESDIITTSYYEGQLELLESLLQIISAEPLSDWECYEGTLHSWNEACYCSPYDEEWNVDEYQIYLDEISWHVQHDTEDMYHKYNGFTSFTGKNVMNIDSYWFTSDEIEAFRVIWQRRISAM